MKRLVLPAIGVLLLSLSSCDLRSQSIADFEEEQQKSRSIKLAAEGPNSEKALHQDLKKLASDSARLHYERAFRLMFAEDRSQRDPEGARDELMAVFDEVPKFAPLYRVAGYASFVLQDLKAARQYYELAVRYDPDYGDAHYGLALILGMDWPGSDTVASKNHLDRATALGVPDTFHLREGLAQMPERRPQAPSGEEAHSHPPMSAPNAPPAADVPTDGEAIPLKLTGIGSAAELERALAKLADPAAKKSLDKAFRYTFTPKTQFRDPAAAKAEFETVIAADPKCAAAHRGLAYVIYSPSDPSPSIASYTKAIELDPEYGEAYYALSFILASLPDRHADGLAHFKRSKELGVPDERKLGERFYPEAK